MLSDNERAPAGERMRVLSQLPLVLTRYVVSDLGTRRCTHSRQRPRLMHLSRHYSTRTLYAILILHAQSIVFVALYLIFMALLF